MKKSTLLLLVLSVACILSLASCDKETNNTTHTTAVTTVSVKPTEKTEITEKPITSADPTGTAQTAEPTMEPTASTDSTVEPTTVPTTEPTKEPTKEPTVAPTQAPTPTPTAVAKPTADPDKYPDDYGFNLGPIRSDGEIFFWKNSRVMYEIPDGAPDAREWSIKLFDSEKNQLIFTTGLTYEELEIYSIVEGDFYKLSEGEVVSKAQQTDIKVFYWVEANGTAKSVGVRSKNFGEVFLEAENIKWIIEIMPTKFRTFEEKKVSPISEDVLLKIKKI